MEGLVVGKTNDWWDGFEERFINIDIGFDVDGVVSKVEELDDSWLLVSLIEEAIASKLFFDELTRS